MATAEHRWLGKSVKRIEDYRFLRGKGTYVDDVVLPGMLHMSILRSPYAHARINSIDTSRAAALPGVVAVVTDRDGNIFEGAAGERVFGGGVAMTLDTVFAIFSTTKAVTGTAVLQLVEEGLVEQVVAHAPNLGSTMSQVK